MSKLRIVDDIVVAVGRLHRLARSVARHDRDLAGQMKSAASSLGLNAGEGLYGRGAKRTSQLDIAMCSGREVVMALRIAGAAGYLHTESAAQEAADVDRIVATLYRLTYPRR
jgi:four helix bundle protein